MRAALAVELLKLQRSPAARVTAAVLVLVVPAAAAGAVAISRTSSDSPLALKVAPMLIGTGWDAYLGLIAQIMSIAALLAVGVLLSWVVGREFTDGTIGSLLALPTPQWEVAAAKLAVVSVWAVGCGIGAVLVSVPLGLAVGLDLPGQQGLQAGAQVLAVVCLMTVLTMPFAWVATVMRGYLAGISALLGMVVITQIITVTGAGAWFPYAAPSLWSGMGGAAAAADVVPPQLLLAVPVGVAGAVATAWRWQRAELV